jgi:hypothetical protein
MLRDALANIASTQSQRARQAFRVSPGRPAAGPARAAVHDRLATIRRRSHERAAAALRPESPAPPDHANDDDLKAVIHHACSSAQTTKRFSPIDADLFQSPFLLQELGSSKN